MRWTVYLTGLTLALWSAATEGAAQDIQIARWQGNRRAALSLTFDDASDSHVRVAIPELNKRGMRGTFYVSTGFIAGSRNRAQYMGADVRVLRAAARQFQTTPATLRERTAALLYLGYMLDDGFLADIAGAMKAARWDPACRLTDEAYRQVDALEQRYGPSADEGRVYRIDEPAVDYPATQTWEDWRAAHAAGHEVAGHGVSHPRLALLTRVMAEYELGGAAEEIRRQIPMQRVFSFRFPGGSSVPELEAIVQRHYLASRPSGRSVGSAPETVRQWEAAMPRELWDYRECRPMGAKDPYGRWLPGEDGRMAAGASLPVESGKMETLQRWVDTTMTAGLWLVTVIHGVEINGWAPLPVEVFRAWLDYIGERRADFWIAPFVEVVQYNRERLASTVTMLEKNSNQVRLRVTDTLDDSLYNVPLTLLVPIQPGWDHVSVRQGEKNLPVAPQTREATSYWVFDAVPDGGDIIVRREP